MSTRINQVDSDLSRTAALLSVIDPRKLAERFRRARSGPRQTAICRGLFD
jgi:hypothetical protein